MEERQLDNVIKGYYKEEIEIPERAEGCPALEDLALYAADALNAGKAGEMDAHVRSCKACAELARDARLYSRYMPAARRERVPAHSKERAKSVNPNYRGKKTMISHVKKNKWLIISLCGFGASFAVPKYFQQFLIIAVIFGVKWVFDTGSTRTLVMVYNAWKRHDERGMREVDELLHSRR